MKLLDIDSTVERIGTHTAETSFKMKTSRKAFQILSDLYSDKPLAIVRELGCNAADSMIAAGKGDQPFHIHLPNALEPWLTIKDFGTGISDSNMYDIYATYFESTKTNTNTQVGCLGLGSKSPFCYTDNFTVTSVFDGEKRIYSAYFNEQNTPTLSLSYCGETNEANGVDIQIPVAEKDFEVFANAVYRSFRFFKVKPTVGGGSVDWSDMVPTISGNGWDYYDNLKQSESYAVMGGVAYPIDRSKLDHTHQSLLYRGRFVLHFEIGELDFTPSRESLSYCEMTIKALNDKMENVAGDFAKQVARSISNKNNIFDALIEAKDIKKEFSMLEKYWGGELSWNGIDITYPETYVLKALEGTQHSYIPEKNYYSRKRAILNDSINLSAPWYRDDLKRGGLNRVKRNVTYDVNVLSVKAYNELIKLGFPDSIFQLTSSLPKLVRTYNGTVLGTDEIRVQELNYRDRWSWETVKVDDLPMFYVVKKQGESNYNVDITNPITNRKVSNSELSSMLEVMGYKNDSVVKITEKQKQLAEDNGCTDLQEWLNQNFKLVVDAKDVANNRTYSRIGYYLNEFVKHKDFDKLSNNVEFKAFVEKVNESIKRVEKYNSVMNLITIDGTDEADKYESDCPIFNFVFNKIGNYSYDLNEAMFILLEVEKLKNSKNQ